MDSLSVSRISLILLKSILESNKKEMEIVVSNSKLYVYCIRIQGCSVQHQNIRIIYFQNFTRFFTNIRILYTYKKLPAHSFYFIRILFLLYEIYLIHNSNILREVVKVKLGEERSGTRKWR